MFEGKTIFVAPLDWGLGHASRCVPLIRRLSETNKVIIGVTPVTAPLLRDYFPALETIGFPSYNVSYGKRGVQWLHVLKQVPGIFKTIRQERALTEQIVTAKGIDVIISDNRYGVYKNSVMSIFICHQINLQLPVLSGLISLLHRRLLRHFSVIWIPDFEKQNERLAGKLSDCSKLQQPYKYVGPLSALGEGAPASRIRFDYLILLSGAEPQRSMLEKILVELLAGKNKRVALVRGTSAAVAVNANMDEHWDICTGDDLKELIRASQTIVCRSGYSTLMDLHILKKKDIILIPTPGQPEQEYLARYWQQKFGARVVLQKQVSQRFFVPC